MQAIPLPDFIYQKSKVTPESNYEIYKKMKEARSFLYKGKQENALNMALDALNISSQIKANRVIDQYDYLSAHYIILSVISNDQTKDQDYIKLSSKLFTYLDDTTSRGVWEESELGLFQMKLYREIGNTMALKLLNNAKKEEINRLQEALRIIEKAEKYIRSPDEFYIKETKQKILHAIEKNEVEYEIIN